MYYTYIKNIKIHVSNFKNFPPILFSINQNIGMKLILSVDVTMKSVPLNLTKLIIEQY